MRRRWRRLVRACKRWWAANVCAEDPADRLARRRAPDAIAYSRECSPHPLQHDVEWIDAENADDAWSQVAGVVV